MDTTEALLDRTYRLLEDTTLTYPQISAGAGVDINWLAKFKRRRIAEPGVNKVQQVHDFLNGRGASAVGDLA